MDVNHVVIVEPTRWRCLCGAGEAGFEDTDYTRDGAVDHLGDDRCFVAELRLDEPDVVVIVAADP